MEYIPSFIYIWHIRTSSENEADPKVEAEPKKPLISPDKEMEKKVHFHKSGWVHYILLVIFTQMPSRHDFNYLYIIIKTRFFNLNHTL